MLVILSLFIWCMHLNVSSNFAHLAGDDGNEYEVTAINNDAFNS